MGSGKNAAPMRLRVLETLAMPRIVLTDRFLKSRKPGSGHAFHFDAVVPGLLFHVTPGGSTSFMLGGRYRRDQRAMSGARSAPTRQFRWSRPEARRGSGWN